MASPTIWDEDFQCFVHAAAIADATGGVTTDANARTALASANAALKVAFITGRDTTDTVQATAAGAPVYDADRKCYVQAAAISNPTGGTTDTELRVAVGQILNALRGARIIAHASFGLAGPTVYDEDANAYTWSEYTTPTGGATADAEGRTQANAIAVALRSAGLLTLD